MANERERRSLNLGMPLYVVAALVVLALGVFAYLRYVDTRQGQTLALSPEARDYVRHLKLSEVTMSAKESYLKQTVTEINGKITNAGERPLETVEIFCVFYDSYGQLVLRQRVPIVSGKMGGLKPGESKSFRLPFDNIPESWNQQMPQLVIAGIRFL